MSTHELRTIPLAKCCITMFVVTFLLFNMIENVCIVNNTFFEFSRSTQASPSSYPVCNGNVMINKTYGGSYDDVGQSLIQLENGDFLIAASSYSFVESQDYWLIRTDRDGNISWTKNYNYHFDTCKSVIACEDGGFALFGTGCIPSSSTCSQYWLVKVNSSGLESWNYTYGTAYDDFGNDFVEIPGGAGFALFGRFYNASASNFDWWLVLTNKDGHQLWNRSYGGPGDDYGNSILVTNDNGLLLAGSRYNTTTSSDDGYVIKTNSEGRVEWEFSYGAKSTINSIIKTSDGGYAFAGYIFDSASRVDKAWFVKITADGRVITEERYDRVGIGGKAYDIAEAPDGGFGIAAECYITSAGSESRAWYIRTDENGNILWDYTFGAIDDCVYSITYVQGGGFAMTGSTSQNTVGLTDVRLVLFPELSWVEEPEDITLPYDTSLHVEFHATSAAGIFVWSINDTSRFYLDLNGVLTNSTRLPSGNYGLALRVVDNVNNQLIANFTIRVLPEQTTTTTTTPTTDTIPPLGDIITIVIIGGTVGVVIIIVVLSRRRKGG